MPKSQSALAIPVESRIFVLRQQKVILDSDLAELYGVPVKRLNEQVKRNRERFPDDFMFQLTKAEDANLQSHKSTKPGRGGRRYTPYAFTEHGAIMAGNGSEFRTRRGNERFRRAARLYGCGKCCPPTSSSPGKIDELEQRLDTHDASIQELIEAIRRTDGA